MDTTIKNLSAIEILDSRGNPTLEVEITLKNGTTERVGVPSGASTGIHEAVELRDNNGCFHLSRALLLRSHVEALDGYHAIFKFVEQTDKSGKLLIRRLHHHFYGKYFVLRIG